MSAILNRRNIEIVDNTTGIEVPSGVELEHLSPSIGTVVHGIDLREPLSGERQAFLKRLFLERKVIFFRDQEISTEQHMAFAKHWGELEEIPFLKQHDQHKEVLMIERDKSERPYENVWHADVTWRERPSLGSVLRATTVPEVGGDTMWSDMYLAYENLPSWMKSLVEDRLAVHSVTVNLGNLVGDEQIREVAKRYPAVTHPVVRTHPETGRKLIFVNRAHTSHIKGFSREDSRWILEYLYSQAYIHEYQVRFKWQKNSIAFWDNRACQHYAVADYYPKVRKMQRVTVIGDVPR